MISIKNVTFAYENTKVLKEVSLDVPRGTSYAIIGASGSGKTTLLYSLAGLVSINEGDIRIDGQSVREEGCKSVTLILQNLGLFPWKTVRDNVLMGLKKEKLSKEEKVKRVEELLNELDIYSIKDKYIDDISGGQKQRVAIGRALVSGEEVLLLDEATSALDSMTKEKIQDLLLEIHLKRNNTMVFVTHSIEEAVFLGEKIVVMEKGKIKEVISNPYFKDKELRKRKEFFDICMEVRRSLYE